MSKPKMGLLLFGHPDYPNDVGIRMAKNLMQGMEEKGLKVVFQNQALTESIAARQAALNLLGKDVAGVVALMGTWTSPAVNLAALVELFHLPLAIWGFGMYEDKGKLESTGSFVALNVIKGCLKRMGRQAKYIFASVDDSEGLERLSEFSRAAAAKQQLRRSRFGLIGYSAMGIYPGTFDHALMRAQVGPEIVQMDSYELVLAAEKSSDKERQEVIRRIKSLAEVADDVDKSDMDKVAGIYLGLKELVKRHQLDAINIKCQTELSQMYGCIACLPASLLSDDGICTSCEGDVPLMVTMAILQSLGGKTATYGDILDIIDGRLYISSCGFAPPSMCHAGDKVMIRDIGYPGFKGPLVSIPLQEGRITLARLVETIGSYEIHLTRGRAIKSDLRQGKFPAVFAEIDGNLQEFVERLGANHFAFIYSDVRAELLELANLLHWKVVDYEDL